MTYYDLGAYTRPITTKSPEAQVWFDRGLNWVFAFNHEEAIACFGKALQILMQQLPEIADHPRRVLIVFIMRHRRQKMRPRHGDLYGLTGE